MTNKKTTDHKTLAREIATAERIQDELKTEATKLYASLKKRCNELKSAELKTEDILVEVANDMFTFISEENHKLLGYSIADCAKEFGLGKDATVRFYAKLGMVNEACSIMDLKDVRKLEAGKTLSANLTDENGDKVAGYNLTENAILKQRLRHYHDLLAEHGAIKASKMAVNMVTSGIESVEDAQKIAEENETSLAEAVNPNQKTPEEQATTARENMLRYISKLDDDARKEFIKETRNLLTEANKKA